VLGSTAERVLRHARTAALVVSDPALRPYERPLVAVDEEGSATAAIELMIRIVAPHVRGALAVHVLDVNRFLALSDYQLSDAEIERYRRSQIAATRQTIELALDELGATELDFDLRFVEGNPREAILKSARAEEADLLAIGTHGRAGMHHLLLGSIAESIIRNAAIDVLVARAPALSPPLGRGRAVPANRSP
jgi:nucleotide-binding universal stress UspA family protein